MRCDGCGEDKNCWTELTSVSRGNIRNWGSMFHPTAPPKLLLCKACLEKRDRAIQSLTTKVEEECTKDM